MPIYSLKCKKCGHIQDEIMGVSELVDLDPDNLDLSELKVKCKKCGKHKFSKQIVAHGKMPHNWSAWQRR
jgi:predicted nucleic acid-binding Zn ribbon protein